jgi:hypothetical protein
MHAHTCTNPTTAGVSNLSDGMRETPRVALSNTTLVSRTCVTIEASDIALHALYVRSTRRCTSNVSGCCKSDLVHEAKEGFDGSHRAHMRYIQKHLQVALKLCSMAYANA